MITTMYLISKSGCAAHLCFCLCALGFIYTYQNEPVLTDWAFQEARKALTAQQMEEKVKQEINESENNTDEVSAKSGKTGSREMGRV